MICALIAATKFVFVYDGIRENIQLGDIGHSILKQAQKAKDKLNRPQNFGPQKMETDDAQNAYTGADGYNSGTGGGGGYTWDEDTSRSDKRVEITLQQENGAVASATSDKPQSIISVHVPRGEPGRSGTLPQMMTILRLFGTIHYGAMLYLTWFMGFGVGLMFTFLFWHLQVTSLYQMAASTIHE